MEKTSAGIKALKKIKPGLNVSARCVLQRHNYADFINTVRSSQSIGVDQISFLAADVSSSAFNHVSALNEDRASEIALSKNETIEFEKVITSSFVDLKTEYATKFIEETRRNLEMFHTLKP